MEAERDQIPKNCSGFGANIWEQSVCVPSQFIIIAQRGYCYEIKDK